MNEFNRSLAIVLGINSYQNGIPKLSTARADAERLAEILREKHKYDCLLRVDDELTLAGFKKLLEEELPKMVGADDRVLFYFAGHGVATNGDDGPQGYILPQDAKLENDATFLQMTELNKGLCTLKCRHMLVILDCCFAGAFRWSSIRNLRPIPQVIHREQYEYFVKDPAWQAIASAAYDQTAADKRHETDRHSPFAKALFAGLLGEADVFPPAANGHSNGDGVITASELYLYLRATVEGAPGAIANRQTPSLWPIHRRHGKGEYVFIVPNSKPQLPPAPPLNRENNPYRGLMPYDESHRDLFFGRQRAINDLTAKARAQALTVVVGASGTGKSSLVKAGVLPQLRKQTDNRWQLLSPIRPGKNPMQTLANLLASPNEPTAACCPGGATFSLANVIKAWGEKNAGAKLLLVVDQLEELVTMCRDDEERERFLASLAECVRLYSDHFHVVLTLRSDFEPHFSGSKLKDRWNESRFIVMPMTQDELREAIEGPAIARVLRFEPPELVDQIINEVLQMPGALPLLSFTLSEMYFKYLERRSDDRALTDADYDTSLGGITGALRRRAKEEYDSLDEHAQDTMRRVILRMISLEGGEVARRRVPLSELTYDDAAEDERVAHVTEQLTNARLILRDADADGVEYVEPAHDALVLGWNKPWTWIHVEQQQQDNLLLQRRLTEAANDWRSGGRKSGQLWDDDPRLPQVKSIASERRYWFSSLESEFITASVKQQSRRRRNRLSWAAAVFVLLASATVVAWYQAVQAANARDDANDQKAEAIRQKGEAEKQRDEARAARTAALKAEGIANEERNKANQERDRANQERDNAQRQQARAESELAHSLYKQSQSESLDHGGRSKALVLAAMAAERAGKNDPRRAIYKARALHLGNHAPQSVAPLSTGLLQTAVMSRRRDMLLSFDHERDVKVWDVTKDKPYPVPKELIDLSDDSIYGAFSLDNENVALIAHIKGVDELWIWKTRSGQLKRRERMPDLPGASLSLRLNFSADGRFVVVDNYRSGKILAWDVERSGGGPVMFDTTIPAPLPVSSNPDRNWMVVGAVDRGSYSTKVIDIATGRPVATMDHGGEIVSAMFSPNAQWLATVSKKSASDEYQIQIWNAETGAALVSQLSAKKLTIADVGNDGRKVLTVAQDGSAALWFYGKASPLMYPVYPMKNPKHLCFSEDENFVIVVDFEEKESGDDSRDKTSTYGVVIWDFSKKLPVDKSTRILNNIFVEVVFDRTAMSATTNAGKVFSWSFLRNTEPSLVKLNDDPHPESTFIFTPNGKYLLISTYGADHKPELKLWDAKTGNLVWENPEQLPSADLEPTFAMDGRHLVAVLKHRRTSESRLYLWDTATKDPGKYMVVAGRIDQAAFRQRTGQVVIFRSRTAELDTNHAWLEECDFATSKCLKKGRPKLLPLGSVQFSLDGESYLILTLSDLTIGTVAGNSDHNISSIPFDSFINFDSFTKDHFPKIAAFVASLFPRIRELRAEREKGFSFFIGPPLDPGQRRVVASVSNRSFALHNANTGLPFTFPAGFDDQSGEISISGDGRWIATGIKNTYGVRVWETATGLPASDEMWHADLPSNLFLSSDGQEVLTVLGDASIRRWYFGGHDAADAPWLKGIGGALTAFQQTPTGFEYLNASQYLKLKDSFLKKLRAAARSDKGACFLLRQYEPSRCFLEQ